MTEFLNVSSNLTPFKTTLFLPNVSFSDYKVGCISTTKTLWRHSKSEVRFPFTMTG